MLADRSEVRAASPSPSWLPLALLVPVLALGAVLRFYALTQRGFVYWDEGKFALEGVHFQALLLSLGGAHGSLDVGKTIGTAKPTHALLIALAYLLLGQHDYAALMLGAVSGVLEVALVFLIGRYLFGPVTGLIAALFLAVSQYDVTYARSALSECDANVLLLLGFWIWLRSQMARAETSNGELASGTGERYRWRRPNADPFVAVPYRDHAYRILYDRSRPPDTPHSARRSPWWLVAAGLAMGAACSTNYRLLVYVAATVAFDLAWTWYREDLHAAAWRVPWWALGGLIVPLAWQVIDLMMRAHGVVLFRSELTGRPVSYAQELLYQLHGGRQSQLGFSFLPYVEWFVVRQGWVMSGLGLLGLALAAIRRTFAWLAVAAPIVFPLVAYTFAPFVVPRNLDAAIPLVSLLSAAAAASLAGSLREAPLRRAALVLGVLLLAGVGGAMSWRLTAVHSGYRAAAQVVQRLDGGRALTTSEIEAFYLDGFAPRCLTIPLPHSLAAVAADVRGGYGVAVMDHYNWRTAARIRGHMPRAARFPSLGHVSLGEDLIASENGFTPGSAASRTVSVYRLNPALLPPPDGHPAAVCNRNTVQ